MRSPRPVGFSLIELMIAVFLLGTGLMALLQLEVAALQRNGAAFDSQTAMTIAQSLIERMRDNPAGVADGAYGDGSLPSPLGPDCAQAPCTPADRAAWDLRQTWRSLAATVAATQGFRGLPNAGLSIRCIDDPCIATSRHSVTITWSDESVRLVLAP